MSNQIVIVSISFPLSIVIIPKILLQVKHKIVTKLLNQRAGQQKEAVDQTASSPSVTICSGISFDYRYCSSKEISDCRVARTRLQISLLARALQVSAN